MSQLGMGVMINMLGGNAETVAALEVAKGKVIASASVANDALKIEFEGGGGVRLWDAGQSCCEARHMVCDDDLKAFQGAKVVDFALKDGPSTEWDYGQTEEVQFLEVMTDRGPITCANHNAHNGYYGGFYVKAEALS